ncbi:carcinoembryonic antigen-related cell adhesion molecule 1-like [Alexandromys fortis]|uniref:carcinoembryonic antigen-related cell adhesion molecule 1-like n=1 Tax=Alexandromys fortis TaxID=100897 RepID=UPI0021529BE4|nr:carcinoembryonic antigen-related cell adhesion molecule 1-like [Microtus fortis]
MELSSALLHKGQLPWRGLLLTASLLIYWSSPTTANVTVEAVPPHVAEGANVLLLVHNLTETPRVFYWYKGKNMDNSNEIARFIPSDNANTTGPAYSGRETIYPNGSLLFQNVTQNDTGAYTLRILMQSYDDTKVTVQFHVHPLLPKPSITSNNSNPMEGDDSVALMCEPETENTSYLWRRNGQSLSEGDRLKLSEDNRTLTLLSVVRKDTGDYECETRNPVSTSRSYPFHLEITYLMLRIPGHTTGKHFTSFLLVFPSLTADPTQGSSGLSGGAIAGIVVGSVAGVTLIAALAYFFYFRKTGG